MGLLFGDVLGGFFFSSSLAAWRDLFMREIGGPESIFFWVVKKESGCLERESTLLLRSSFYRGKDKNSGEENLEEKEN